MMSKDQLAGHFPQSRSLEPSLMCIQKVFQVFGQCILFLFFLFCPKYLLTPGINWQLSLMLRSDSRIPATAINVSSSIGQMTTLKVSWSWN